MTLGYHGPAGADACTIYLPPHAGTATVFGESVFHAPCGGSSFFDRTCGKIRLLARDRFNPRRGRTMDTLCSIPNCDGTVKARGWCNTHYTRWRNHGTTQADRPRRARTVFSHGDVRCAVGGCPTRRTHREWCAVHYQRWLRSGDFKPKVRVPRPSIERFVRHVDVGHPLGCWEWVGSATRGGYGRFNYPTSRDSNYAHRFAFEFFKGERIPTGWHIDHLCRNPPCVNPDHLEAVTPAENSRRAPVHAVHAGRLTAEIARLRGLLEAQQGPATP